MAGIVLVVAIAVAFLLPRLMFWLFADDKSSTVSDAVQTPSLTKETIQDGENRDLSAVKSEDEKPADASPLNQKDARSGDKDDEDATPSTPIPSNELNGKSSASATRNDISDPKEEPKDEPPLDMNLTSSSSNNISNWRCACEGGFLPPGMLQSLGGAEAVIRMSTGQCYHKNNQV